MARKLKKVENETQTLFDLEYGKKHSKMWKMTNTHCRTWIMARKLKNVKMRHKHCMNWNMARNTEKRGK